MQDFGNLVKIFGVFCLANNIYIYEMYRNSMSQICNLICLVLKISDQLTPIFDAFQLICIVVMVFWRCFGKMSK